MSLVKFAGTTPRKKLPRRKITGPARDRLKKCIERDRCDAPPQQVPIARSSAVHLPPIRLPARRAAPPLRYAVRTRRSVHNAELERQVKELVFNTLTQDLTFLRCDEETSLMQTSLDLCNRISKRLAPS